MPANGGTGRAGKLSADRRVRTALQVNGNKHAACSTAMQLTARATAPQCGAAPATRGARVTFKIVCLPSLSEQHTNQRRTPSAREPSGDMPPQHEPQQVTREQAKQHGSKQCNNAKRNENGARRVPHDHALLVA